MTRVELIFDSDCPYVEAARAQLAQALADLKLLSEWMEWDRASPNAPQYVQRYGSPTILVNGADVVAGDPTDGAGACRLYYTQDGQRLESPPAHLIRAALQRATESS